MVCPRVGRRLDSVNSVFSGVNTFSSTFNVSDLGFNRFIKCFNARYNGILKLNNTFFTTVANVGTLCVRRGHGATRFLLDRPVSHAGVIFAGLLSIVSRVAIFGTMGLTIDCLTVLVVNRDLPFGANKLVFLSFCVYRLMVTFLYFYVSTFLEGNNVNVTVNLKLKFCVVGVFTGVAGTIGFLGCFAPFSFYRTSDVVSGDRVDLGCLLPSLILTVFNVIVTFVGCAGGSVTWELSTELSRDSSAGLYSFVVYYTLLWGTISDHKRLMRLWAHVLPFATTSGGTGGSEFGYLGFQGVSSDSFLFIHFFGTIGRWRVSLGTFTISLGCSDRWPLVTFLGSSRLDGDRKYVSTVASRGWD